jgi:hypothetical protein
MVGKSPQEQITIKIRQRLFKRQEPAEIAKALRVPRSRVDEEHAILSTHDAFNSELTPQAASLIAGVNERRVRKLCDEGRIKARRIGERRWVINRQALIQFINKPRATGAAGTKLLHGKKYVHPKTAAAKARKKKAKTS